MQTVIKLIKELFLTAIEEVLRIFGVIWLYMNVVVNVSGVVTLPLIHIIIYLRREIKKTTGDDDVCIFGARGPPIFKRLRNCEENFWEDRKVFKTIFQKENGFEKFSKQFFKRKMTSKSFQNGFSNEKWLRKVFKTLFQTKNDFEKFSKQIQFF